MGNYDDIINMPHHTSPIRPRMSARERAAQFSPFAALTGYDAAIAETGRLTDARMELDENEREMLDEKLRVIAELISEKPSVSVTCFRPDERKSGGAYLTATGRVKKIDTVARGMVFEDKSFISLDDIYGIDILEENENGFHGQP